MSRTRCFPASILLVLCSACGEEAAPELLSDRTSVSTEIINGHPTRPGDFPPVGAVLVRWRDADGESMHGLCTGTLIAPDVVLTAGHCKVDREVHGPVRYYFSLARNIMEAGDVLAEMPRPTVRIKKMVAHPGAYLPDTDGLSRGNDVSVAFLAQPISNVVPSTLLAAREAGALKVGAATDIVGYGMRSAPELGGGDDWGIKAAAVSVINRVGRYELQVGRWLPTPQQCDGDSGGPSYMKTSAGYRLVGITSRAYDSHGCTKGGVNTRVDAYRQWIGATMAAACKDGTRVSCHDLL